MDTVRLWIFGFFAAAILLLLLHLWIASGIAALKELRPKWKTIALPQFSPTLQNLLKKPKLLKRNGSADFISYIISLLACRWTCSDFPAFPAGLDYKRWLCSDFISSNSSWFALDFYSQCSTSAASL